MITMAFGGVAELHIYPQYQRPKKLGLYLLNGRQEQRLIEIYNILMQK